jgi:hypothetical protein
MPRTSHPRERNCLIIRHELIKAFATLTAQHASRTLSNTRKLQGPMGGQVAQVLCRPTAQVTDQVEALRNSLLEELAAALGIPTDQVSDQVARVLQQALPAPASTEELMNAAGLAHRPHFRTQYPGPIMQGGWLVRTHARPNHPQQRYRITAKGRAWLDRFNTLPKP